MNKIKLNTSESKHKLEISLEDAQIIATKNNKESIEDLLMEGLKINYKIWHRDGSSRNTSGYITSFAIQGGAEESPTCELELTEEDCVKISF